MTPRRVACSPCLGPALSVVQVLAPVVVLCDPPARLRSPRSRGGWVTVADAVFEWADPLLLRRPWIRVCGSTDAVAPRF